MSRVTAPVSKLSRSINSAASTAHGHSHPVIHNAGAVLLPKYAELLRNRRSQDQEAHRNLSTAHRPTPQPSLVNRPKPLMQTFSTTSAPQAQLDTSTIDYMVFPTYESLAPPSVDELAAIRFPVLPDNFLHSYGPEAGVAPLAEPEINIVSAADPDTVLPAAALTEVEGMGIDGVELKFAHETEASVGEGSMLRDLWKGLMDDVIGGKKST